MNNKSIQILRGTRDAILRANEEGQTLLDGQLLYNTTENTLSCGGGGNNNINKDPIVCKELRSVVYQSDNETTRCYSSITHDTGLNWLNFDSGGFNFTDSNNIALLHLSNEMCSFYDQTVTIKEINNNIIYTNCLNTALVENTTGSINFHNVDIYCPNTYINTSLRVGNDTTNTIIDSFGVNANNVYSDFIRSGKLCVSEIYNQNPELYPDNTIQIKSNIQFNKPIYTNSTCYLQNSNIVTNDGSLTINGSFGVNNNMWLQGNLFNTSSTETMYQIQTNLISSTNSNYDIMNNTRDRIGCIRFCDLYQHFVCIRSNNRENSSYSDVFFSFMTTQSTRFNTIQKLVNYLTNNLITNAELLCCGTCGNGNVYRSVSFSYNSSSRIYQAICYGHNHKDNWNFVSYSFTDDNAYVDSTYTIIKL